MSTVTNLKYTGTTPGADASTYVLFSTALLSVGNWGPMGDVHAYHYDIAHSQAGTVKGYRSKDRGVTWVQFYDSGLLGIPTYTSTDVVLVEGFADFKFEWVNGGVAQGTWNVHQDASIFP
jgi:hypothetical protein